MAVEIEALIKRRSRELANLVNGPPGEGLKAARRRQRAQRLQADLLELIAMRRRLLDLAQRRGSG